MSEIDLELEGLWKSQDLEQKSIQITLLKLVSCHAPPQCVILG